MLGTADDSDITFQLMLQKRELTLLCLRWEGKVCTIPCEGLEGLDSQQWGPSDADLASAAVSQLIIANPKASQPKDSSDEEGDSGNEASSSDEHGLDDDIFDEIESVAFTDIYCSLSMTPDLDY
jgi:hypothetical protein